LLGASTTHILGLLEGSGNRGDTRVNMKNAAIQLLYSDMIIIEEDKGKHLKYKLTQSGLELQRSEKKYAEYLEERKTKELNQAEKANLDSEVKELQKQDLITKLNTINPVQLDFWKAQKQKNVQTTIIAIISAAFSLISMLKAFGIL